VRPVTPPKIADSAAPKPRSTGTASSPAAPDPCREPFVIDENGDLKAKLECLRQ